MFKLVNYLALGVLLHSLSFLLTCFCQPLRTLLPCKVTLLFSLVGSSLATSTDYQSCPSQFLNTFSLSERSEVIVLDVLIKNEASRSDMIDIMKCMHDYLGKEYPTERRVPSGGDQLTCERQVGAQRHTMDGDTIEDRLGLLEPVTEDWHCLVCFLSVSLHAITLIIIRVHVHTCTR